MLQDRSTKLSQNLRVCWLDQEECGLLFVCGADINCNGKGGIKGGRSMIADLQAEGHATDSVILTLGFT